LGLLGIGKEHCQQLHFRDDRSFIFRKLPIENTFVLEKQGEATKAAWMMPYRVLKRFNGHKGIRPGMVLISYNRDIILDKWGQVGASDKPEAGKGLIKDTIAQIATGVFYQHETGKKRSSVDRMIMFLGSLMMLFGFVIALIAIRKAGLA